MGAGHKRDILKNSSSLPVANWYILFARREARTPVPMEGDRSSIHGSKNLTPTRNSESSSCPSPIQYHLEGFCGLEDTARLPKWPWPLFSGHYRYFKYLPIQHISLPSDWHGGCVDGRSRVLVGRFFHDFVELLDIERRWKWLTRRRHNSRYEGKKVSKIW